MHTNCIKLDPHKQIAPRNFCAHKCLAAVEREKNLHRAIIVGAVLILILVAVVYYFWFVASGNLAGNHAPLEIQTITLY